MSIVASSMAQAWLLIVPLGKFAHHTVLDGNVADRGSASCADTALEC